MAANRDAESLLRPFHIINAPNGSPKKRKNIARNTASGAQANAAASSANKNKTNETMPVRNTRLTSRALERVSIIERKELLEEHYKSRVSWAEVRSGLRSTAKELLDWLDDNFKDRRKLGVVLSDFRDLDPAAYSRLKRLQNPEVFSVPSKLTLFAEQRASEGLEVCVVSKTDPNFQSAKRKYGRAHYHSRRLPKPE